MDNSIDKKPTRLISRLELAERLNVHPNTLDRARNAGQVPCVRIGGRVMFDWRAVCKALGITRKDS